VYMYKKRQVGSVGGMLLALAVVVYALPAAAQPIDSFFDVFFELELGNDPQWLPNDDPPVRPLNSGWTDPNGIPWFEYTPPEGFAGGTLWNQWYYDHTPTDPDRWKTVTLSLDVKPFDPDGDLPTLGWVIINWTNEAWGDPNLHPDGDTGPGGPPPSPLDEQFIVRSESLWTEVQGTTGHFDYYFEIEDLNPEWISIDVQGQNVWISGTMTHECVPEPMSMVMLGCVGVGMAVARRMWRKT